MKNLFVYVAVLMSVTLSFAQEQQNDSTQVEKLDEVLVKAVRVDAESPITHSNITKKEISKRNLGQDMPEILKFLPSVVNTSDAGASVGYTGIRIRGVSPSPLM